MATVNAQVSTTTASTYRYAGREWRQRVHNLLAGTPTLRAAQLGGHRLDNPGVVGLHERDPLQEWRKTRLLRHQQAGANAPYPERGHRVSAGSHSPCSTTAAELRSRLQELLQIDCDGSSNSGEQMPLSRPITVDTTPVQRDESDVTATAPGKQRLCQPCQALLQPSESLLDDRDTVDAAAMGATCASGMMHCQTSDRAGPAGEECIQLVHRRSAHSSSDDDIKSSTHQPPEVTCAGPRVSASQHAGSASHDCAARAHEACLWVCLYCSLSTGPDCTLPVLVT